MFIYLQLDFTWLNKMVPEMKKVPDPLSGLENSNLTTKEDDKQEEDHRM